MDDLDYEVANAAEWQTVDRKKTKPKPQQPVNYAAAAQARSNSRRPLQSARPTTQQTTVGNRQQANGAAMNAFSRLAELERRKSPSPPAQPRAMNGIIPKTAIPPKTANTSLTLRNRSNSARQSNKNAPQTPKGNSVIKAGRSAYRNAEPSTVKVDLPVPYIKLKDSVLEGLPGLPPNIRGELLTFNYITEQAGAYVPPPRNDARFIGIWGSPVQAQEAAKLIRSLFFSKPLPGPQPLVKKSNKGEKFAATNQKAMQKAETAEAKRRNESILESLRRRPEGIHRPCSLLFIWPDNEFPIHECLGGEDLRDFDDLRQKTGCHIYIDENHISSIRVDGPDNEGVEKVLKGIRLHWKGLLAKTNVKVKAYFVEVPPVRPAIGIDVRTRRGRTIHVPRPHGNGEDPNGWSWLNYNVLKTKMTIRMREGVERSLQALKHSEGHLRMRVDFGTFVLSEYQNVLKDGKIEYSFEEFRSMLLLGRTRGYLDPELSTEHRHGILSRCLSRKDILTQFNPRHSSLEETLPSYTATFNFLEGDASLRLEVEFNPTPKGGYERGNKTWYKTIPEDNVELQRPILQVGIMDFERSDWELGIKRMGSPTDNSNISRALKEFANSVVLRTGEDTPPTPGTLRVVVPTENSGKLKSIEEKSSFRYRIKQTNYVLEVARYDTFECKPSLGAYATSESFTYRAPQISETAVTTWGASMYDTTWDDYIGQNATSRRGENVHWKPSFKSFFPSSNPEAKDDIYAGFTEFLDLVKEVSEIFCQEHKLPPPADAKEAEEREEDRKNSPALEDIVPFYETWPAIRNAHTNSPPAAP